MRNSSAEQNKPTPTTEKTVPPDIYELPPPSSGKELAEYLTKVAATLTPEEIQNLDWSIKASRESAR